MSNLNVATSVLPLSGTSRCWISTLLRWIYGLFGTSQHWISTSRHLQLHPWNVATLSPNVATLPLFIVQKPSNFCPPLAYPYWHSHISIVTASDLPVASTTTSLCQPRPVLRPCLAPPSHPNGALTPALVGSQ